MTKIFPRKSPNTMCRQKNDVEGQSQLLLANNNLD
jgi:hypothetical protein